MKPLKIATIVAAIVSSAQAVPTNFSNNLKGYAGQNTSSSATFLSASRFEPTTIAVQPAINFSATGAKFGEFIAAPVAFNEGFESRNFLRTTEQAYGTVSFVAYVTVQRDFAPTFGQDGYGAVYFGLGSAEARYYRTPDNGDGGSSQTSTFFKWQAQDYISWHAGVKGLADTEVAERGFAVEPTPRQIGTTRLAMIYNATAKTVSYSIDYNYSGAFSPDQTTPPVSITAVVNEFIAGERSSIFFGSNGEVLFSDFSVQLLVADGPTTLTNSLTNFTGSSQSSFPGQPFTLFNTGLNVAFIWDGGDGAFEKIAFTSSGATFGSFNAGDGGRNYLHTNATNYASVPFSAYVTVDRSTREAIFFGLGKGARAVLGQPDASTGNASVFLELQGGFDNVSRQVLGGSVASPTSVQVGFTEMTTVTGPMRLRMDYKPTAATVTYSIDYNPSGPFVADQIFDAINVSSIAPEWTSGEASSIYFGGENGMTFTDFSVEVGGGGSPYTAWAGSALFNNDANNDGIKNGIAWILGAATPGESIHSRLPKATSETAFLALSFQRIPAVGNADLWVEFSSDLGISDPWTAVNVLDGPLGGVTVTDTPGSALNTMIVRIPKTEASPAGKLFARIKVTQP